ncbi:MAG: hypothetical protein WBQ44_22430 [Rhodococcus sp. (in: high G+C Gram-positive bacteria)]
MNNDYSQLKGLADVYLEDSYVLSILEAPGELAFALDAVLTPESPRYQPPKPDEQYCYALGRLVFAQVTASTWVYRSTQQYTDAAGDVDLGNIDFLSFDQGVYVAEGDWGRVEIHSATEPRFVYD